MLACKAGGLIKIKIFNSGRTAYVAVCATTADAFTSAGNESVPKIIQNNTIRQFFKTAITILLIFNHNSFRVLVDKIASVYFSWKKNIYILALETASPRNQHCANCFGTLPFSVES